MQPSIKIEGNIYYKECGSGGLMGVATSADALELTQDLYWVDDGLILRNFPDAEFFFLHQEVVTWRIEIDIY